MAGSAGRDCVIKKGGTTVGSFTANNVGREATPIESTSKGDGMFKTYLADKLASSSIEFGGEGVESDQTFRDLAFSATESSVFIDDLTYYFTNGDVLSGDFIMTSYQEGSPQDGANSFSCSFASNGTWTYTTA